MATAHRSGRRIDRQAVQACLWITRRDDWSGLLGAFYQATLNPSMTMARTSQYFWRWPCHCLAAIGSSRGCRSSFRLQPLECPGSKRRAIRRWRHAGPGVELRNRLHSAGHNGGDRRQTPAWMLALLGPRASTCCMFCSGFVALRAGYESRAAFNRALCEDLDDEGPALSHGSGPLCQQRQHRLGHALGRGRVLARYQALADHHLGQEVRC